MKEIFSAQHVIGEETEAYSSTWCAFLIAWVYFFTTDAWSNKWCEVKKKPLTQPSPSALLHRTNLVDPKLLRYFCKTSMCYTLEFTLLQPCWFFNFHQNFLKLWNQLFLQGEHQTFCWFRAASIGCSPNEVEEVRRSSTDVLQAAHTTGLFAHNIYNHLLPLKEEDSTNRMTIIAATSHPIFKIQLKKNLSILTHKIQWHFYTTALKDVAGKREDKMQPVEINQESVCRRRLFTPRPLQHQPPAL